jgi:hypothetical protein
MNKKNHVCWGRFMSKKVFTEKEIAILFKNPFVHSVSRLKGITYSEEFKRHFIRNTIKENYLEKFLRQLGLMLRSLAERESSHLQIDGEMMLGTHLLHTEVGNINGNKTSKDSRNSKKIKY